MISCISCSQKDNHARILKAGEITLIDSTKLTDRLIQFDYNSNSLPYFVFYNGKYLDTISLKSQPLFRYNTDSSVSQNISKKLAFVDTNTLEIEAFPQLESSIVINYKHYQENNDLELIDSTKLFQAFPLVFRNLSDSAIHLGVFDCLTNIVKQARDEHGIWRNVEKSSAPFCATGAADIVIEPNGILIAKALRQRGEFKTECRFKYENHHRTVFSNVYIDFVDKKQFEIGAERVN